MNSADGFLNLQCPSNTKGRVEETNPGHLIPSGCLFQWKSSFSSDWVVWDGVFLFFVAGEDNVER